MSWIVDEIWARGGAVPFDGFMELALYHPENGYYSTDLPRYGRAADFLTAPTASEWYPRLVARLLAGVASMSGPLRFVDLAAGDGSMLAGLFDALVEGAPDVIHEAVAVETSKAMGRCAAERASGFSLTWVSDLAGIHPVSRTTAIHASELYDAQPVARVVGRQGAVNELWVAVDPQGGLSWREHPARQQVEAYFHGHGVTLEEGQLAEANLGAGDFHSRVLNAAGDNGLVLILDYGYDAARLYNPRGRRGGSLATYCRHQVGRDPLQSPGEIDLTAHVNWDDLRSAAVATGWVEVGLWSLAEFLVRAGMADELEERGFGMEAEIDAVTFTARQEVKRLLDPDGMGSDLKVLVQANGTMVDIASKLLRLNEELGIRN